MKKVFNLKNLVMILGLLIFIAPTAIYACDQNTIPGNCVKYARQQVPELPSIDLTSYTAKKGIINHYFPRVRSVAVMPGSDSRYGHLAVVRNVAIKSDGTLLLTLEESNWGDCKVTIRPNITPESRGIVGYFDPAYPSADPAPQISSLQNNTGYRGNYMGVIVNGANFDTASVQGMIFGGWCDAWNKCPIPNDVITKYSSGYLVAPVTLNSPGTYTLYMFNSASGKTSNGKQIYIQ